MVLVAAASAKAELEEDKTNEGKFSGPGFGVQKQSSKDTKPVKVSP